MNRVIRRRYWEYNVSFTMSPLIRLIIHTMKWDVKGLANLRAFNMGLVQDVDHIIALST